jgi:two-component system, OmpR family, sensor histidine kinase VicK
MAAHELRTPIQPVLALSQHMLSNPYIDVKERQHYLDIIVRNAVRLQHLTEDILDITKIETRSLKLKTEPFDVNQVILKSIQDAEEQLDKKTKIKFQFMFSQKGEEANLVKGDRRRLAQVMANLLNNSIKFTPKGEIRVNAKRKDQFIFVQIRDTGSGIDPEIMGNLFSKFASKSVTGTGLGLFISKGIIEALGGSIWAENNSDSKGASFTFRLPLIIINQDSNKAIL